MAAGLVTVNFKDAAGATLTGRFWSSDGTTAGLLYSAPVLIDGSGNAVDYAAASPIKGSIASGSSASDAPVFAGGRAATANPTAVTDGQVVAFRADKTGRLVITPHQVRDLRDSAVVTVTSSTTAADLIAAQGASVFADIASITLTNTSATATEVQILDADGTTVRWAGFAPASDMRGIVFPSPLKGAAANAKWMIKTVTSVASLKATVQYSKEV